MIPVRMFKRGCYRKHCLPSRVIVSQHTAAIDRVEVAFDNVIYVSGPKTEGTNNVVNYVRAMSTIFALFYGSEDRR